MEGIPHVCGRIFREPMSKKLLFLFLDFIIPPRCVHCGRIGSFLCPSCLLRIEYLEQMLCPVCTKPSIDGFAHPVCRTLYTPDRLFCPFHYRGSIASAIKKLKYKKRVLAVGKTLIELLLDEVKEHPLSLGKKAVVVPVPLHPFKKIERGYNQAEILAKIFAESLGLKLKPGWLERKRETLSQTKLKLKERRKNVKDAFAVPENYKKELRGEDIVLFDDVFTTGATVGECANTLKRAGARFVYIITLAKD